MSKDHQAITVRPAVSGDARHLAALDGLVNPSPWTAEQFAACCGREEDPESAMVIDRGGQPVGFVVFSRVLDEACIHNIAVYPVLQGKGLGRLLVTAVLAQVRDGGAAHCYLEVRESNLVARRLYESFEFQPDGIRRNYYPTATGHEDAVLMSRRLVEQEC